jgi:trk system potassium uptake protein TrkH
MHHTVARPLGIILLGLALLQAACAALTPIYDLAGALRPIDAGSFLEMMASAVLTGLAGALLTWHGKPAVGHKMRRREAILVVAAIWVGTGIFGGLPFVIDAHINPIDAYFEAISGFTTTGATILPDIEGTLSRPLLMWRSLMQWVGGMGIVVLFVAVFPNIGVGGKHMFRSEVPGPTSEGLQPRIAETALVLWRLYLLFTLILFGLLMLLGMDWFDAVCHAFTTLSTGGFSTRNASIGAFDSVGIEVVLSIFMLIAGTNFGLYYGLMRYRTLKVFSQSTEFKVYLAIVVVALILLTAAIWPTPHSTPSLALRKAMFMVATTVTSTGFGTDPEYMSYPGLGLGTMLLLMFIGGSAGSTAGGIKVARMTLLAKVAWAQTRTSFRPSVVQVVRMGRTVMRDSVLADVTAFFAIYMLCLAVGSLFITITDSLTISQAFGANLTCLSNMGPAPF